MFPQCGTADYRSAHNESTAADNRSEGVYELRCDNVEYNASEIDLNLCERHIYNEKAIFTSELAARTRRCECRCCLRFYA